MIQIIRQYKNPDCSYCSTVNCAKLNNPRLDKLLTQDVANRHMVEYINKHPRDAFKFLKDKGFDIKMTPLTFASAKVRMKKGSAIVIRMKYTFDWWFNLADDMIENWRANTHPDPSKSHFFCMKQEEEKFYVYDSNFPIRYEITDIDRFFKEGVFSNDCFQIR